MTLVWPNIHSNDICLNHTSLTQCIGQHLFNPKGPNCDICLTANTCATAHFVNCTFVWLHACATACLCDCTLVWLHTCATAHLCDCKLVWLNACATAHLCDCTLVRLHTCVTAQLCDHIYRVTFVQLHSETSPRLQIICWRILFYLFFRLMVENKSGLVTLS